MSLALNIKNTFSNTRGLFILCLSSIALGLSVSKPLMPIGVFGLLIVWFIDGDIKAKLKAFWNNKTALVISSIYLISIFGLIHTNNFEFAAADLRRKLPLFFIPFCVSGFSAITKKELHLLLKVFISGVLISTFWSLFVYLGGLNIHIVDARDLSRFHSHIRFGLAVALAIFFCFYYLFQSKLIQEKVLWLSISCWLISSFFLFSLFTGFFVFGITAIIMLAIFSLTHNSQIIKYSSITIFLICLISSALFINSSIKEFKKTLITKTIKEIPFTKTGHPYQKDEHTQASTLKENGYYIKKHISWWELQDSWNLKSTLEFTGLDLKGQQLKTTLIRFITSKGQRKDREAVEKLTKEEVSAIENGISNCNYLKMNPINKRIHQILWEYNAYTQEQSINGHSVLMRWKYWETALKITKNNLFIGVGTGDIQDSFNQQYEKDKSPLAQQYRLRAHNQYLTYCVSFGLIGFLWFLICLLYPLIKNYPNNYLYLAFFIIVLLSMLTEDTLETHAGISFFVFFNALFLFSLKPNK